MSYIIHKLNEQIVSKFLTEANCVYRETAKGELSFQECPFCGAKGKFSVNKINGLYRCFRGKCDVRGGFVNLMAHIKQISCGEAYGLIFPKKVVRVSEVNEEEPLSLSASRAKKKESFVYSVPPVLLLPSDARPCEPADQAYKYLQGRGVSDADIDTIGAHDWPSRGRVIFPVIYDGEIYGHLARDYTGSQQPKVLNEGKFKQYFIWNYDNAQDSEELVICEGVISAIKAGVRRSVALFGKSASPPQIELISQMGAKRIYIALDLDAHAEAEKLYLQLTRRFRGQVYKVETPAIYRSRCNSCGDVGLHKAEFHPSELTLSHMALKSQFIYSCERCGVKNSTVPNNEDFVDLGDLDYSMADALIRSAKPFLRR